MGPRNMLPGSRAHKATGFEHAEAFLHAGRGVREEEGPEVEEDVGEVVGGELGVL